MRMGQIQITLLMKRENSHECFLKEFGSLPMYCLHVCPIMFFGHASKDTLLLRAKKFEIPFFFVKNILNKNRKEIGQIKWI